VLQKGGTETGVTARSGGFLKQGAERMTKKPKEQPSMPNEEDARGLASRDMLRRCVILFERRDGHVDYTCYGYNKEVHASTCEIMYDAFDDLAHCFAWDTKRLGYN